MKTSSGPPSLSSCCRLVEATFARMGGNEEDAPLAAIRVTPTGESLNSNPLHPDEPPARYVIGRERETSGHGARQGPSLQSPRRAQGHVGGTVWRE
jgi:hypothetical protein